MYYHRNALSCLKDKAAQDGTGQQSQTLEAEAEASQVPGQPEWHSKTLPEGKSDKGQAKAQYVPAASQLQQD